MKYEVTSYNTRKLLSQTLKKLMEEKEFAKISISEITETANLNRKTFYYHFKNTYDLLAWTINDETIEIVKKHDLTVDYPKVIALILDYLEDNEKFMGAVMHSYAQGEVRKFLYRDMRDAAMQTIDSIVQKKGVKVDKEYLAFIADFAIEAIIGMIMHWVDAPEMYERARLEKYLDRVFKVTVENLLTEEL